VDPDVSSHRRTSSEWYDLGELRLIMCGDVSLRGLMLCSGFRLREAPAPGFSTPKRIALLSAGRDCDV
jgi:hypothetical protein